LRLFSFGGYGLALAALALVVFGAIECPPLKDSCTTITGFAFGSVFVARLNRCIFH